VRKELGLGEEAVVFLYVGRLNREKGIPELAQAFSSLAPRFPRARLLLVGPDEDNLDQLLPKSPDFLRVGYTDQPERYMAAADVFVLPSHREGFGSTIIEAAACGLPSIASRIYGLTDAVVEGQTGLLHSAKNVSELAAAMAEFCVDGEMRRRMGRQARERVIRDFRTETLTGYTMHFYRKALGKMGLSE
jgi:glycosyltransferase involved in cell wall biosynthesis